MRRFPPAAAALLLAGCGYIAGPLPPLANIPAKVDNVAAVQRGSKLIVQFAVPAKTTEGLPVSQAPKLDLRIGPGPVPFNEEQWSAQAQVFAEPAAKGGVVRYEAPAGQWIGHEVVIGVRAVGSNGRDDGWAYKVLPIVKPPEVPHDIQGEIVRPTPETASLKLTWQAAGPEFRVLRAAGTAERFDVVATVKQPAWTDPHLDFGVPYRYLVQTVVPLGTNGEAESEPSAPFTITVEPPPPPAPTGLRAVPAPNSVELAWEPDAQSSVTGYRVYRSTGGGAPEKIGETGAIPTYSDRSVEHGKTYRYTVTAVDAAGRESAPSAAVEIMEQ
jgi:hypothetical protein